MGMLILFPFLKMKLCLHMNPRKKTLTQKTNSLDTMRLITVQSPFMMVCIGESRGRGPRDGIRKPPTGCVTQGGSSTTAQS